MKGNGWIVCSFYTKNTGYEAEVEKLIKTLEGFNLEYKIYSYAPVGSWRANLNYKSECILKAMREFPDKDVVFLDADAKVRRFPVLFSKLSKEKKYDMAAHFHPYVGTQINGGSLLSGTLWIQNAETGVRLVKEWDRIGRRYPDIRHQHCLRLAINELSLKGTRIKVYRMPKEYTLIFDFYRHGTRPVIEHFQKSRQYRNQVGRGRRLLRSSFMWLKDKPRG